MKKFKKQLLAGILAATTMMSMVGCGSAESAASQTEKSVVVAENADAASAEVGDTDTANTTSGEVTELTYWYSNGGSIQKCNEALVEKFNETVGKELGIHVTAEYQGSYTETTSKLQAAAIANTMPEVAVVGTTAMGIFMENDLIQPLNEYVERDIDASDFFPGLLKNTVKDDTWYGVPYMCSTPILYMNTTLLEQAGLDTSGPKTWDELAEYCKAVKEKTGAYGLSTFSYDWFLEAFLLEHGVTILNEDETATNLNCEETKEIFQYYKDLVDKGYVHWGVSGDESSTQLTADYTNQNCAMWFASTASLTGISKIAEENGFELNTCYLPAADGYGVPIGGCSLVMFSTVPEEKREATWEFIKFMTDTEQTAYASEATGYVPLRASAELEENLQALYKECPQYKVALDQLRDYSTGRPLNKGYFECQNVMNDVADEIMINGGDMDAVLSDAETKMNQLLNE